MKYWQRWLSFLAMLLTVTLLLQQATPAPVDLKGRVDRLTSGWIFNFFSWELEALSEKIMYGFLSPHRFMDDTTQARFVLNYLDDIRQARQLADEIERIYVDPEIEDPDLASEEIRVAHEDLRRKIERESPIAEAILEDQVSVVLADAGFGGQVAVFPPVSGTFTPLPHVLVISPRERIESAYQQQLVAGLTAAEQTELENEIMEEFPDYSAYVTSIGGLAAYPAMLLESTSIDWVADVVAHEWAHHFLVFRPLGWYYMTNGETRTINETAASLLGEWAGQEVILRFYAPLLDRGKRLPGSLTLEEEGDNGEAPTFDFGAEMRETRVVVDRLLEEGKIEEAEFYMEARRRFFVEHGYRLRRLNQAYFAFHGAYASSPGASGENPIGPLVRQVWAQSATPDAFLDKLGPVTSLAELRALENTRAVVAN